MWTSRGTGRRARECLRGERQHADGPPQNTLSRILKRVSTPRKTSRRWPRVGVVFERE
jgi:hypothetical protein